MIVYVFEAMDSTQLGVHECLDSDPVVPLLINTVDLKRCKHCVIQVQALSSVTPTLLPHSDCIVSKPQDLYQRKTKLSIYSLYLLRTACNPSGCLHIPLIDSPGSWGVGGGRLDFGKTHRYKVYVSV